MTPIQVVRETLRKLSDGEISFQSAEFDCTEAIDAVEKQLEELKSLREYCTLTFGESHPEMKKCPHENVGEKMVEALQIAVNQFRHAKNGNDPNGIMCIEGCAKCTCERALKTYNSMKERG